MNFGVFFVKSKIADPKLSGDEKIIDTIREAIPKTDKDIKLKNFGTFSKSNEIGKLKDEILSLFAIFISTMTGGTEDIIKQFENFKKPVVLLSKHTANSLAASIEAREYLKTKVPIFLVHENNFSKGIKQVFHQISEFEETRKAMSGNLVTIGGASSWLINSMVPKKELEKFGFNLKLVPIDNFIEKYKKHKKEDGKDEDVLKESKKFIENAQKLIGVTEKDVYETMESFKILKDIVETENIKGLTIKCIDLIGDIESSVCLPVSLLNDLGITTACEGDLRSLFGMIIGSTISKKPCFMGNLSNIISDKNEIMISHCTIPVTLTDSYSLKTHFETNKGVAIKGDIKKTKITIFNVDVSLKYAVVTVGEMLESRGDNCLCRTQLRIRLPNMDYVDKLFGNHQIIVLGENRKIEQYLNYLGLKTFFIK